MKQKPFLLRQLWLQQEDFRWIALVWGSLLLLAVGVFAAAHSLLHRSTAQV